MTQSTTRARGDTAVPAVQTAGLTRRYRGATALDGASLQIRTGSITGLVGRNGSGKTTLLRLISGQEFPSSGTVAVFGQAPTEHPETQHRMVFVREDQQYPDFRIKHAIRAASWSFPQWDAEVAGTLLDEFELPLGRRLRRVSRGMRSAVGIVIGIASRADLTVFDEPYAGLDPVARQIFYRRLLEDYAAVPRTVVVSTHHVDEIASLLEDVIVLDRGRVAMAASADDVRGSAMAISGSRDAVTRFTAGRVVWAFDALGRHARAVVAGSMSASERATITRAGLEIEPVTLQQVLAHHTTRTGALETVSEARA